MDLQDPVAAEIAALVSRAFGLCPDRSLAVSDAEVNAAEQGLGVSLPHSFRTYLRYFGAAGSCLHKLFGLPRAGLYGDIVLMNEVDRGRSPGLVKIMGTGDGGGYFLDTTKMSAEGECPVIRQGGRGRMVVVASTFTDFLDAMAEDRL